MRIRPLQRPQYADAMSARRRLPLALLLILMAPPAAAQPAGVASIPSAAPAPAQDGAGSAAETNETDRFFEPGFGLSFNPPAGARRLPQPGGGASAGWVTPEGFRVGFRIRRTRTAIDSMADLVNRAYHQISHSGLAPDSVTVEERRIADRPGVIQAFGLREDPQLGILDPDARPEQPRSLVYVLVCTKLGPYTFAIHDVFGDLSQQDAALDTARALAESTRVMPPAELDQVRYDALAAGRDFLMRQRADAADLLPARRLPPLQEFRVLDPVGRDVGIARLRTLTDPVDMRDRGFGTVGELGTAVELHTVLFGEDATLTRLERMFVAATGDIETVSARTTLRPRGAGGDLLGGRGLADNRLLQTTGSPADTGITSSAFTLIRDQGALTVTQEKPADRNTLREVRRFERFAGLDRQADAAGRPARGDRAIEGRTEIQEFQIHGALPPRPGDTRPVITPAQTYLNLAEQWTLFAPLGPVAADAPLPPLALYAYDADTASLGLRLVDRERLGDGGLRVAVQPTPASPTERLTYAPDGALRERVLPNGFRWVASSYRELADLYPWLAE